MEYIRSLRTGIMAEYPVMSTSQGTYVRIEQTSEAIRVTYETCRAGGARGLELRTAVVRQYYACVNLAKPYFTVIYFIGRLRALMHVLRTRIVNVSQWCDAFVFISMGLKIIFHWFGLVSWRIRYKYSQS